MKIDIKLKVRINDTIHELSIEEAKTLRDQLDSILGKQNIQFPVFPKHSDVPFIPYYWNKEMPYIKQPTVDWNIITCEASKNEGNNLQ